LGAPGALDFALQHSLNTYAAGLAKYQELASKPLTSSAQTAV
jgi:hypothetical protein